MHRSVLWGKIAAHMQQNPDDAYLTLFGAYSGLIRGEFCCKRLQPRMCAATPLLVADSTLVFDTLLFGAYSRRIFCTRL